jgi:hypothetical protein
MDLVENQCVLEAQQFWSLGSKAKSSPFHKYVMRIFLYFRLSQSVLEDLEVC